MFDVTAQTNGEQDCTEAILRVDTALPCERPVLLFKFQTGHQYSTQLLVDHIETQIRETLSEIREKAYQQGWKDKAGKKRKRTEFFSSWNPNMVGW